MKRLIVPLFALCVALVAVPAQADYVRIDPAGRDGCTLIDTSTGDLLCMRAGTVVARITSTGDIKPADDLVIADDLNVTGLATIGETLGVTGVTTLTGALNANGGIAVDTTAFTVADTTGNTAIAGTLDVTGDVAVNTNKFTVTAASGNTLVAGTLGVTGALTGSSAAFSGALTSTAYTMGVDFSTFRIHDNIDAILDQAAADDDDLTLVQGTFGTAATTVESIDCGGLNDTTQYAVFWFVMPGTYPAGATVTLTANAGMVETVADQSSTLDFECYVPDYANADATVSTDLITTAATDVNFTTFADYDFVLDDDAAGYELDAGTVVQCRVTSLCDDDGNAGNNITFRMNRLDVVISP